MLVRDRKGLVRGLGRDKMPERVGVGGEVVREALVEEIKLGKTKVVVDGGRVC